MRSVMHAAEIVVRGIERDGRDVMLKFLAESVREPREPALLHPDREVLALNIGR